MPNSKSLSINSIFEIANLLPELDGFLTDGKATAYKFDTGTRWNIAKNLKIIKAEHQRAMEDRDYKIREFSPVHGNMSKESAEAQEKFRLWSIGFGKDVVEVDGILLLKRSKLFANDNPIPGTVMSALMDIIEDDGDPIVEKVG